MDLRLDCLLPAKNRSISIGSAVSSRSGSPVIGCSKPKQPGVQGQPLVRPVRMGRQLGPVARVAQHRMARFGEMDANLVPAARFQPDLHERRVRPMPR